MDFDFAESVDNDSAIPEQFRPMYAKDDASGKFVLLKDPVMQGARSALVGLNGALKAARAEAKNLKGKQIDLSALSEFGETPTDIITGVQAKIQELNAALAQGTKINPEKIKQELTAAFSQEKTALTARNEALTKQLHTLMVDQAATSAIAELKGVPELLLPFVRQQVKVVEEDGQLVVKVVDSQNDVRFSTVTGHPMTIKELVQAMKADQKYGRLFESEAPQGGGMQPGAGQRQAGTNQGQDKSAQQKIGDGLRKRFPHMTRGN